MGYRNSAWLCQLVSFEELKTFLLGVFPHAGTHHWSQNGEEERGGGHVAGALGEGGDEEAQHEGDGCGGDALQRGQLAAQPSGQTRFLQHSKEGCQAGEARAQQGPVAVQHLLRAAPMQTAVCRKTLPSAHRQDYSAGEIKISLVSLARNWKMGDLYWIIDSQLLFLCSDHYLYVINIFFYFNIFYISKGIWMNFLKYLYIYLSYQWFSVISSHCLRSW